MITNITDYNTQRQIERQIKRQTERSAYWPFHSDDTFNLAQINLKAHINSLLKTLARQLTGSADPHVWSTTDANGETVWNAVDSTAQRTLRNATETEMRIWLEERYTLGYAK